LTTDLETENQEAAQGGEDSEKRKGSKPKEKTVRVLRRMGDLLDMESSRDKNIQRRRLQNRLAQRRFRR
jgi:hypothetical protein